MTGHAHVKVQDAAIERQSFMREEQYKHFRWTNRTVRAAFWGVVIIPVGLFLTISATQARKTGLSVCYSSHYYPQNKWDWTGKRKNESLNKSQ
ncbi:hypothetical protein R3P38DRAFT_2846348 [Favolaschia claudopus]|uniref:NADH dehydrogenase [ubiquinone] 1 beta subcomplex subunit 4 n=1 Tax=Favolaschia claudopus TaxID=2862362 RepID=A0AAW0DT48_9AGAR